MRKDTIIRHASMEDLNEITELEAACFNEAEAASGEAFRNRLQAYPDRFWLLIKDNQIISMVNGMVSNIPFLEDRMYSDSSMHEDEGEWQMIFGVETRPEYRRKGYAELLLKTVISEVKTQNKKGIILTCKSKLIHYYEKFGFENEGLSESNHGGESWYQMKLLF